jgi:uncharacterized peroxidase-related enzyme
MSYLDTPADGTDDADVQRLYEADRARQGYVANYTRIFALRPEVFDAWAQLNGSIKAGMDLRRYELATLAAARRLRSSYCSLAHGSVLRDKFYGPQSVARIAADHHEADLEPVDVAIMDFADKVAHNATAITEADIAALREYGLSDVDIFQVALAAAARCFFSTALDAVGAEPDHEYRISVDSELRQVLTVGRPVADTPAGEPSQS